MLELFSPQRRFQSWRRLWLELARAERALGLSIPEAAIAEMKAHLLDIDPGHAEGLLGCIDRGEDILIPGAVRASIGLGSTEADIASLVTAVAHISAEARGVPDIPAYVASLSAAWQAQDAAAA